MDVLNRILGKENQGKEGKPESSELEEEMAKHGITPEEVITEFADCGRYYWNQFTSEIFENELEPRLRAQSYDEANELYREMQDEGLFILPGIVSTRVEETIYEKKKPHLERYFESIDKWGESLEEFGKAVYRQSEDIEETVEILDRVVAEADKLEPDYDVIPLEYMNREFYQIIEVNRERINAARALYHMDSPSKEDIRENISEVPEESLEKFRTLFSEEGPVEVYEQSGIQDYN